MSNTYIARSYHKLALVLSPMSDVSATLATGNTSDHALLQGQSSNAAAETSIAGRHDDH
jgi:hypothetical protein